jgi:hypothetical protein
MSGGLTTDLVRLKFSRPDFTDYQPETYLTIELQRKEKSGDADGRLRTAER